MKFMNEYDITHAMHQAQAKRLPNLRRGAVILCNLRDWANDNSDGWAYWPKPARAAAKLMDLLDGPTLYSRGAKDCTEAQLKAALTPIKSFLTRQQVDHSEVFGE